MFLSYLRHQGHQQHKYCSRVVMNLSLLSTLCGDHITIWMRKSVLRYWGSGDTGVWVNGGHRVYGMGSAVIHHSNRSPKKNLGSLNTWLTWDKRRLVRIRQHPHTTIYYGDIVLVGWLKHTRITLSFHTFTSSGCPWKRLYAVRVKLKCYLQMKCECSRPPIKSFHIK